MKTLINMFRHQKQESDPMQTLIDMLKYRRPEGNPTQKAFCNRFLLPVFGRPDEHGNYILQVGDQPNICFAAHHDTVHNTGSMQKVVVDGDFITAPNSNCLGADCTTGVWLILEMIKAGVKGTYVVHAAEEVGCQGSKALVNDNPEWLEYTDAVISFDRLGTKSVVTHQMGMRTCSDAFADSLGAILKLGMTPDQGGVYTDSNEYEAVVPECTNISVGYYDQHTSRETQSISFATQLRDALVSAEWHKLVIERDPSVTEYADYTFGYGRFNEPRPQSMTDSLMLDLVCQYPRRVAHLLEQYGFDAQEMAYECGIYDLGVGEGRVM